MKLQVFKNVEEEKWANFFDRTGIKYIYRPETFKIDLNNMEEKESINNELSSLCRYTNNDDTEIHFAPSFFLPDVYEEYCGQELWEKGIFLDINPYLRALEKDAFNSRETKALEFIYKYAPKTIYSGSLLPIPEVPDDAYTLTTDQLIDGDVALMKYCDKWCLATPQHHSMQQDCQKGKDRMMIPFHEAIKAEKYVLENN